MISRGVPGWEGHEAYIQDQLGLSSTIASGSKFHDQGDAVDHQHYSDDDFRFIADCKYTESSSYSVSLKMLRQWEDNAREMGKRFILPLRFWQRGQRRPYDYVVANLDDFQELLEAARIGTTYKSLVSNMRNTIDHLEEMVLYSPMSATDRELLKELKSSLEMLEKVEK